MSAILFYYLVNLLLLFIDSDYEYDYSYYGGYDQDSTILEAPDLDDVAYITPA